MKLRMARTQKSSGVISKSVLFCLDARAELDPEEAANVKKYGLGAQVIYNSEASKRQLVRGHERASSGTLGGVMGAWVSLARAKMALNITIDGLTYGQHIECNSLEELLGAEEAIMEACQATRTFLDVAATFDGTEQVHQF